MDSLLTRAEKLAWRKAVANAPAKAARRSVESQNAVESTDASREAKGLTLEQDVHPLEQARKYSLQAAS